jgi:hypothetical protein
VNAAAGAEVSGFTLAPIEDPPPQEPGPTDIPWDPILEISAADDSGLGSFQIQTNTLYESDVPAPPGEPRDEPSGFVTTAPVAAPTSSAAAPHTGHEGPPGWADEDAGSAAPGARAQRTTSALPAGEPRHQVFFEPESGARAEVAAGPAAPSETHAMPASSASAVEEPTKPPQQRAVPRSAPRSAGVPASKASPAGLVAGIVLLAVVGGGGWFGWSMMSGAEPPPVARTYAPVEIPAIPAEYEPIFRQLSAGALLDLVEGMTQIEVQAALPEAPPSEWLAGQYLANASSYPQVATYWNALNAHLMSLRAQEEDLFRERFAARLAEAAVATPAHEELIARALAGFRASLPERDRAYDRLSAALVASIALHEFLIRNEDRIDYRPVVGGTVLEETQPASEELGDQMWGKVDAITDALEAMEALGEQVTTRRLFSLTLDGVASAAVK